MIIANKGRVTMYLDDFGFLKEGDIESPLDIKEADISWGLRVMYGRYGQAGVSMRTRHVYQPKLSVFYRMPLIRVNLKKIV